LAQEGCFTSWVDGAHFGEWFQEVYYLLRRMMPNALFGFPGLSPQLDNIGGVCIASDKFLNDAKDAVNGADFLCQHSYWASDGTGHWQKDSEDFGGWYYRRAQRTFPSKKLFITEYSCNNPNISDADKGSQYKDYLLDLPGVEAAFAFCLSWDFDPGHEGFVRNGEITNIPRVLGA
jgi:hypothetical protein